MNNLRDNSYNNVQDGLKGNRLNYIAVFGQRVNYPLSRVQYGETVMKEYKKIYFDKRYIVIQYDISMYTLEKLVLY